MVGGSARGARALAAVVCGDRLPAQQPIYMHVALAQHLLSRTHRSTAQHAGLRTIFTPCK